MSAIDLRLSAIADPTRRAMLLQLAGGEATVAELAAPGEASIAELCRREGINTNLYYRWSKDFLEAGKKRLAGDTVREANTDEVVDLKRENKDLKQAVVELYLRNDWLKKSLTGQGVTLDDE